MRVGMLVAHGLVLGAIGWMASLGGTEQRAAELFPRGAEGDSAADRRAVALGVGAHDQGKMQYQGM